VIENICREAGYQPSIIGTPKVMSGEVRVKGAEKMAEEVL